MHRDRLESAPLQDILKKALLEVLGRPVQIVVRGPDEALAPKPRKAGDAGPKPGERVKRVLDRFEGKIVDVDGPSA